MFADVPLIGGQVKEGKEICDFLWRVAVSLSQVIASCWQRECLLLFPLDVVDLRISHVIKYENPYKSELMFYVIFFDQVIKYAINMTVDD